MSIYIEYDMIYIYIICIYIFIYIYKYIYTYICIYIYIYIYFYSGFVFIVCKYWVSLSVALRIIPRFSLWKLLKITTYIKFGNSQLIFEFERNGLPQFLDKV